MAFSNSWVVIGGNLSFKWGASSHQHLQPSVTGKGKNVVHYHKPPTSDSSNPLLSKTISNDLKTKFMHVYDQLKSELIHDPSFEFDDASRQWVDRMIDYNVPRGKMMRGLTMVESYQLLKGEHLTDDEVFLASALGWCLEWLQAYLLVLDDILDNSHTRRGHPCWFRLPEVGMIAVNDAVILRNHIPRILKRHFSGKHYYVNLLDLFNEAEFQTISGQMIDVITTLAGQKDLSKYSLSLHHRICLYKTSYYSCYLPIACALRMFGENLDDHVQMKDILIEIGIYGTVQDDYLDTFGDPNVVGKIGTDIENFKCSWLVVKALELSNNDQKKILKENYGVKDPHKVEKVKKLYHTLNLERVYEDYESKTHAQLIKSIEELPSKDVELQTASGQMIDLITTLVGEKDLSKYSLSIHRRIVQYKTAYYSFYLPVACALMSGENLDDHVQVKDVLVEMGTYFQVQDDYLDCFGAPEVIGKI